MTPSIANGSVDPPKDQNPTIKKHLRKGGLVVGVFTLLLLTAFYMRTQQKANTTWSSTTVSSYAPEQTTTTSQPTIVPITIVEPTSSTSTASIDLAALNQYWLQKVNAVRQTQQRRELVIDQRFVTTASEWADEMRSRGDVTHVRTDGKTMHQWIDTKHLDFTDRNSPDGWKTNYFVENIARYYAEPTTVGLEQALDKVLVEFLDEGPTGAHYQSIYHPDWNSVGLGYSFDPSDTKTVRVYFAFHYGSLKPMP